LDPEETNHRPELSLQLKGRPLLSISPISSHLPSQWHQTALPSVNLLKIPQRTPELPSTKPLQAFFLHRLPVADLVVAGNLLGFFALKIPSYQP
jgi:hypothetical protein